MGLKKIGEKQIIYLLKFAKYFLKKKILCIFKIFPPISCNTTLLLYLHLARYVFTFYITKQHPVINEIFMQKKNLLKCIYKKNI